MNLPPELATQLAGYAFAPVQLGQSGAAVWHCTREACSPRYLKVASLGADLLLHGEAARLRWMQEHGASVPAVRAYVRRGDVEYLLLDEVAGIAASDPRWMSSLPGVMAALGVGLARLHRMPTDDCPFDHRIVRQLEEARLRIAAGKVDEGDFDDVRMGRTAMDLFAELLGSVPAQEDLVVTHGDFSLPNVILRQHESALVRVAGLVDCGRAGVADRYQDIALAVRSITYNFGSEWVPDFLNAYGVLDPEPGKVAFFALLDEFF